MKEFKLPSVNNIKIGDIGFRFRKDFIGHGIFEGQVIEINNTLRRCIYSDGDIEDLTLEQLSYWNSKYLPSKKKIDYKDHKKDQVIDEIIDSDTNIINENLNEVEFSNNCNDNRNQMCYLYAPYLYAPSTCTSTCTSTFTSTDTLHRHLRRHLHMHLHRHPPNAPYTCTLHLHLPTCLQGPFWSQGGGELFLKEAFDENWGCAGWIRGGVFNTCFYVYNRHRQTRFFTTYSLKKVGKGPFSREVCKETVHSGGFMS